MSPFIGFFSTLVRLFLSDMYRLLDPSVHSVAFSVDDFGPIPIYDVVEGDSMSI